MRKRMLCLLMCLGLFVTMSLPVCAAKEPEKEPVTISTAEQLLTFAEQCRLDIYSQGLTVTLTADIDMSGASFSAIPVFAGSFDGGGHRITGLNLSGEGSVQGLFRYVTDTAVVQNLAIEITNIPTGSRSKLGGIAGSNGGQILNCTVTGVIDGVDNVGGIAGVNEVTGVIESCTADASVSGLHFVGGVCGTNLGVVRSCKNTGTINTSSEENTVDLTEITMESLTNSDSAMTSTDLGGIAGRSSGVIRGCTNTGIIGYRQMGYNVGGIAGTQSGYLAECTNRGDVFGRKEVGGIVGQMEPMSGVKYSRDTLQILKGQLNTLSSLTNRASGNMQNGSGAMNEKITELREQTDTAKGAVEVLLPGGGDDLDALLAAQNALTESLGSMPSTVKDLTAAAKDTTSTLTNDLQAISDQINTMSGTLGAASQNMGATFTDVSDSDTDKELGGKVQACVNYGAVLGDRNVGGISGAMAMENDLSPEDDWTVSGSSSMNVATELRAVLLDCENRGEVTANKQHGGGIVGWQYLGLVKNCLNAGNLACDAADYVGGIAGYSSGYLRGSSAKCRVSGSSYVGGIAGSGEVVTDCLSVVVLVGSGECVGAVLGQAADLEAADSIKDNYYMVIDKDLGAIDAISYGGTAEPRDYEAFMSLASIPEPLRTVTVQFIYTNGTTKTHKLTLGDALSEDMIPAVPQKEGYVGYWEGLAEADTEEVLFDMTFDLTYVSDNTVLESTVQREDGKAILLVQGNFTPEAAVEITACEDRPHGKLYQTVREAWSVTVSEPEQVSKLRYSIPTDCDSERIEICVRDGAGQWRTVDHHVNGSYAVFDYSADDNAFAMLTWADPLPVLAVLLIGAVLVICQRRKMR